MLWKEQIEHLCGLWHKTPETAIFLIFFVKWRFISIASNLDIWHPVWRPTHDIADGFVIDILTTFDNEFIMDMTADKAVGEVTHGKTEKVPGDCLHDVLYEFRTVAFVGKQVCLIEITVIDVQWKIYRNRCHIDDSGLFQKAKQFPVIIMIRYQ